MWQNTYLMNLPDWFVLGAAEYLAKGWDIEMDDEIRDLMVNGKINKLTKLTGRQAVVAGHSLWNFIVEKYGKSNLNQIKVFLSPLVFRSSRFSMNGVAIT